MATKSYGRLWAMFTGVVLIAVVLAEWGIHDAKQQSLTTTPLAAVAASASLRVPDLSSVAQTESGRPPSSGVTTEPFTRSAAPRKPLANATPPPQLRIYIVRRGDTLSRIAKSHGVPLKALLAVNDLKADRLSIGQQLRIPAVPPRPSHRAL